MKKIKLTPAESRRLEQFVDKVGGQNKASLILHVSTGTLSRSANRRTAPSNMLRDKLVEQGIVKP